MEWVVVALAFIAGASLGSFLNVVITRVPNHESVVHPRSRCPNCKTPIPARDNIPVLSYLLLRGHCRTCNWPIPIRYWLVEVGVGLAFATIALALLL